ncbi:MAG: hypothetical protein V5A25_09830 [Halovenus sp.]
MDLYARLPLRIGLGPGAGTIALSSQDTGSGATTNRDEAITQGILVGALAGVPFVVFGLALSEEAIAVLGLWGAPRLEIVGVGLATATGNVFTASAFVILIASGGTEVSFVRPRQFVIAKQLLTVSAPKIAEGMVATVIEFPFNALLLVFGAEVNAAYQIDRRVYQQVTSPLSPGRSRAAATPGRRFSPGSRGSPGSIWASRIWRAVSSRTASSTAAG